MSGQGTVSRAGRTSGWADWRAGLTDHKETKVDHWRIQETGRCAGMMAQGKKNGEIYQSRLTEPGQEKKTSGSQAGQIRQTKLIRGRLQGNAGQAENLRAKKKQKKLDSQQKH